MLATQVETGDRRVQMRAVCSLMSSRSSRGSKSQSPDGDADAVRLMTPEELRAPLERIVDRGVRRVLLVAPDQWPGPTATYLEQVLQETTRVGLEPELAIPPLGASGYRRLHRAGATGIVCHQVSYDPEAFAAMHPEDSDRAFRVRLDAPLRAADAGIHRIGLSVLLGAGDPERDVWAVAAQSVALTRRYPNVEVTVDLPRLVRAPPHTADDAPVSDDDLIGFYQKLSRAVPSTHLAMSMQEPVPVLVAGLEAGVRLLGVGHCGMEVAPEEGEPLKLAAGVTDVGRWLKRLGYTPVLQ